MKKNIIKKEKIVENIKKIFFEKPIIGIVNFSNITSLELKEIRKILRENNIYIRVFKNTLMMKAFLNTINFDFFKKLSGQKLFIFSDDIKKIVSKIQFISKNYSNFKIVNLYLFGRVFDEKNYNKLLIIGSKQDIINNFIAILQKPILNFIYCLQYYLIKIIILLKKILLNINGDKNVI